MIGGRWLAAALLLSTAALEPSSAAQLNGKAISDIQQRLKDLEAQVWVNKLDAELRFGRLESFPPADLEIAQAGYTLLRTPFGSFTAQYVTATPLADGFEVTLSVGNLTSARFNGARVQVSYGPPRPEPPPGLPPADAGAIQGRYLASLKYKNFDLSTAFPPGQKTVLKLALTPAKPEEVRQISVAILFNEVGLIPAQ